MKINEKTIGIFLIILFLVGIPVSKGLGLWITESVKIPVKMIVEGEEVYNPDDIRGSYGFKDVSEIFDIPMDILLEAFQVPDSIDGNTLMNKDLEARITTLEDVEVGNGSVKLFVAFYNNLPYDFVASDDYLPKHAVQMLKTLDHLTDEQKAYLDSHSATVTWGEADTEDHEVSTSFEIKGKTTFNEVLEMGVSKEQIQEIVGGDFLSNQLIKDYCLENDLSFSEVKIELLSLIE